jgi:hypothetical protein
MVNRSRKLLIDGLLFVCFLRASVLDKLLKSTLIPFPRLVLPKIKEKNYSCETRGLIKQVAGLNHKVDL